MRLHPGLLGGREGGGATGEVRGGAAGELRGGAAGELRGGAAGELSGGAAGEDTETESSSVRAMASSPQLRWSIFVRAATNDPVWPMDRRLWL